ncbi:hypothetical protein PG993_009076 [Apiospora rasikravindrae]|uniref:Polyketide cyclase/dehydrase n=1 Tax=Apiospora rasikravindrae TaxID=990691 RepID=A0ABR1SID7_9PEZI
MSIFTHEIEESILIDAPPTEVWSILTDLASWSDWNTFVIKAQVQPPHDRLAVGSHQLLTISPSPPSPPSPSSSPPSSSSSSSPTTPGSNTATTTTTPTKPSGPSPSVYGNVVAALVEPLPLSEARGGRVGELRWGGAWLHALVLDTQHWCLLQPEGEDGRQTLFTQGELFSGLMVPVTRAMGLFEQLRTGYDRMNEDLRRRAEGQGGGAGGGSVSKY